MEIKAQNKYFIYNSFFYTDPYTSKSSAVGFSGTLGEACNFEAAVTVGTVVKERKIDISVV